jgi:diacylglycerol kinase (ATP)
MTRGIATIAYNPKSGSYNKARMDQLNAEFTKAGFEVCFKDSYSPDLMATAKQSAHLCVVGGDGTLRDVIACLAASDDEAGAIPPISMYPGGTINLVAREANYSRNIPQFVRYICGAASTRRHFYGALGNQPILVCASVGPDSIAVDSVSEALKSRIGRFAYAAALSKLLLNWPRHPLTVTADGEAFACEAAFVLKGRYFAGPWQLSRDADVMKPEFQLLLLPRARRRDYARLMLSAMISPNLAAKEWVYIRAKNIDIDGQKPLPVQVDGDIIARLPVQISINPKPIDFV